MALIVPVSNGEFTTDKIAEAQEKEKEKKGDLGYDQFLQLLCAEMQYQDPLEPTTNTEYIAQLATFSQLEATLNMQDSLQSLSSNDLVGKYVMMKDGTEGYVDYVQYLDGEQTAYINGKGYSLTELYQVSDTDYVEATTIAAAFAAAVKKAPEAEKLTLTDLTEVQNLQTVYESLTSYQKGYIDDDTLTKYKALLQQMATLLGNASTSATTDTTTGTDTTGNTAATGTDTTATTGTDTTGTTATTGTD